jgi:hypothetical protein
MHPRVQIEETLLRVTGPRRERLDAFGRLQKVQNRDIDWHSHEIKIAKARGEADRAWRAARVR